MGKKIFTIGSALVAVLLWGFLGGPHDAGATLILSGGSVEASFIDLGAQGFGNAPRMLTLQGQGNATNEAGQIVLDSSGVPSSAVFDGLNSVVSPGPPSDKNSAPSLFSLGWATGEDVGIGFNTSESGTGISLNQLILSLYNGSNVVVGTFPLASPVSFNDAQLDLQTGNGNAVFEFILDPTEQGIFSSLVPPGTDLTTFHVALAASLSDVTDGPESFLGVLGPGAPPPSVPEPSILLLLGLGLLGLVGLGSKFRK